MRKFGYLLLLVLGASSAARAMTLSDLYDACIDSACTGGNALAADLVSDASGTFYGVANKGGVSDHGTVYALVPNADRTAWTYTVVYKFCSRNPKCGDSALPTGRLVIDTSGNLYGVTTYGASNSGVVYELTPNAAHTVWTQTILHRFCNNQCLNDGYRPVAGLTYAGAAEGLSYDGTSPLYGATARGGRGLSGTVFEIAPVAGAKKRGLWSEKAIHSFNVNGDGSEPAGGLLMDANNDIYGTTAAGGVHGGGLVFKLEQRRPGHKSWTETKLYEFCAETDCSDGRAPQSRLAWDAQGRLVGTAVEGGQSCAASGGTCGVVFALQRHKKSWTESVLHTFCQESNCSDGAAPSSGLTMGADGTLYGTTTVGGNAVTFNGMGVGTVYALEGGTFRSLYSFCHDSTCADGAFPGGGDLAIDADGHLFGTTVSGGQGHCFSGDGPQCGLIFELVP